MKIVHVIAGLELGGVENLLRDLSLAQVRAGADVHLISLTTCGQVGHALSVAGVSVRALGLRPDSIDALRLVRLGMWLRYEHADIVQTWMYHANLLGGLAARLVGPAPTVWGLHHVLDAEGGGLKPRTLQIARMGARLSGIIPSRIICCGQAVMNSHIDRGYAPQRMVVIPNGVDVSRFRPDASAAREMRAELGVDDATPLIGMVARYHPAKDHRSFIGAAALLHQKRPEAHFVLCGAGADPANAQLSMQVQAVGLRDSFHLLGVRSDLPRIYSGLDVAALSSRSEAFPLVLCEAMACGIPCVATSVGDCAHIVGNAGRLVPAGETLAMASAWLDLLQLQPSDRAALAERARERIRSEFDVELTARRYLELYRELAQRNLFHSRFRN